jgi:hypothetical protein
MYEGNPRTARVEQGSELTIALRRRKKKITRELWEGRHTASAKGSEDIVGDTAIEFSPLIFPQR